MRHHRSLAGVLSVLIVAVLAAALLALAGCGADADEPEVADLERMVLPKEEFGDGAEALELYEGSGYRDSWLVAARSLDPDDTSAEIEATGWLGEYDLSYYDLRALFAEGEVLIEVGSRVTLYADSAAAAAVLRDVIAGWEQAELSTFELPQLGDEAIGRQARLGLPTPDLSGEWIYFKTVVFFRLGRLVAHLSVSGTPGAELDSAEAEALARALEQRIVGVLRGEITEPALGPSWASGGEPVVAREWTSEVCVAVVAWERAGFQAELDAYPAEVFENPFGLGETYTPEDHRAWKLEFYERRIETFADLATDVEAAGVPPVPNGEALSRDFVKGVELARNEMVEAREMLASVPLEDFELPEGPPLLGSSLMSTSGPLYEVADQASRADEMVFALMPDVIARSPETLRAFQAERVCQDILDSYQWPFELEKGELEAPEGAR